MENKIKQLEKKIQNSKLYNKQLKSLMIKYRDGKKERETIVEFNQPCCLLLKNGFDGVFLEANKKNGIASSVFKYKHSNGKDYEVDLKGTPPYRFPYGKGKSFLAYIHHENAFSTVNDYIANPHAPIDKFNDKIDHSFSAFNKWEAEAKKTNVKLVWAIGGLIAILLGGFILYNLLVTKDVSQAVATIPNNATIIYNVG